MFDNVKFICYVSCIIKYLSAKPIIHLRQISCNTLNINAFAIKFGKMVSFLTENFVTQQDYKNHPKQHGRCFSTQQEPFLLNPQDETKYRQRIPYCQNKNRQDEKHIIFLPHRYIISNTNRNR